MRTQQVANVVTMRRQGMWWLLLSAELLAVVTMHMQCCLGGEKNWRRHAG